MLSASGVENVGRIAPKDSYGATAKHFFNCTETASPIVDVIGGLSLPADGINLAKEVTIGAGDDSGINTRLLAFEGGTGILPTVTGGTWTQPGSSDFIAVACGKCRINASHPDGDVQSGGFTSIYIGEFADATFRAQPYQAIFQVGSDAFSTPFYPPMRVREEGEIYIYAAVKRGSVLEHYANGILTGSRDYTDQSAALKAEWDNFTPQTGFATGHSAYCSDIVICTPQACDEDIIFSGASCTDPNMTEPLTVFDAPVSCDFSKPYYLRSEGRKERSSQFNPIEGNINSTSEYADDIYGLYTGIFENGAPTQSEIIAGINYMKNEWQLGNKVIYPGWMF